RRAVLSGHREGPPAVPDAVGGDRAHRVPGDRLRVDPHVRAARRPIRGGDLPVLCARGGGGVRAAPAAPRRTAAGAGARLSPGPALVRARELPHSRERAVGAPAGDRVRLPDDPAGRAGLLPVDSRETSGAPGRRVVMGSTGVQIARIPVDVTVPYVGLRTNSAA